MTALTKKPLDRITHVMPATSALPPGPIRSVSRARDPAQGGSSELAWLPKLGGTLAAGLAIAS